MPPVHSLTGSNLPPWRVGVTLEPAEQPARARRGLSLGPQPMACAGYTHMVGGDWRLGLCGGPAVVTGRLATAREVGAPNRCASHPTAYTQLAPRTQPRFRKPVCQPNDAAIGVCSTRQPTELGPWACGWEWSPRVSQPWLVESTAEWPLSGIGSCCEHRRRGGSWLCPRPLTPPCPAPPPCLALLWRSAV